MSLQVMIARKESGKSQDEVAKALRIARPTYSKKETGKYEFTLKEAIRLSDYFNKSLDELFKEDSKK